MVLGSQQNLEWELLFDSKYKEKTETQGTLQIDWFFLPEDLNLLQSKKRKKLKLNARVLSKGT